MWTNNLCPPCITCYIFTFSSNGTTSWKNHCILHWRCCYTGQVFLAMQCWWQDKLQVSSTCKLPHRIAKSRQVSKIGCYTHNFINNLSCQNYAASCRKIFPWVSTLTETYVTDSALEHIHLQCRFFPFRRRKRESSRMKWSTLVKLCKL